MKPREPYLTAQDAIAYLNLGSLSALYRLIREHRLPCGRVGRKYRFDRAELDVWVHGHGSEIEWVRAQRDAQRRAS